MELGNQPSPTASIVRPQHAPLQKRAFVRIKKKNLHMQEMAQQQPTVTESSLELKSWCLGYVLRSLGVSFWNVQLGKLVKSKLCGKVSPSEL